MKYFYEKPHNWTSVYGEVYRCDHPLYNEFTLYLEEGVGLAVIQQRHICKNTYWSSVDPWLANDIYLHGGFQTYFEKYAQAATDGLYPTVTVRQIMWGLRMKPLKKEYWETTFDHVPI